MLSAGAEGTPGDGCGAGGTMTGDGCAGCTFRTAARCVRRFAAIGNCAAIVLASARSFIGSVSFASSAWTNATSAGGIDGSSGGPPGSFGGAGNDGDPESPPRSVVAFAWSSAAESGYCA